jgi:hypothetical protein
MPAHDFEEFNLFWKVGYNKYYPCKSIEYIDYPIKKEYVDNMEVLIGPKCSNDQKNRVKQLMNKYCNNPIIIGSTLE